PVRANAQRMQRLRAHYGVTGKAPEGSRPLLILLCGLPGTGKSYLAEEIQRLFPMVVLRSDEIRKILFPHPRYTSDESGVVYLTSYELISALLVDGFPVIFDATNLTRSGRRRAARLADQLGVPRLLLLTVAPPEVVAERMWQRAAGVTAAYHSDANWQVHEKLAGTMEAVTEKEAAIVVDTSVSLAPALDAVTRLMAP
ncbi:MAG TPA: ATP-binding protein, partial [Chloroflexota bacterium]|nr:ATP-binding protein [Chloroflexota bacterium]